MGTSATQGGGTSPPLSPDDDSEELPDGAAARGASRYRSALASSTSCWSLLATVTTAGRVLLAFSRCR